MGISMDGFVSHPHTESEHPAVVAWKLASLGQVDTHIMGRTTYQEMAAYWPTATGEYAAPMNNMPKVVFSSTLDKADWADSRIASGDLAQEIADLKLRPGKDIMAHGGASFAQALSAQGLVDEYRLMIYPIALGVGAPLFAPPATPLRLTLADATTCSDGTAIHVYRPVAAAR
jgi:dihydrofolate reductase